MKTILRTAILLAGAGLLSACGSSDGENPYEQNRAETGESGQAGGGSEVSGPGVDLSEQSGRWSTESGAVGEGSRLVIDLTSEGVVSIDVRTIENGSEAIMESSTGKATTQGSVIRGTTDQGEGVHGVLKKYATWTLDPSGTITGGEGTKPLKISRGDQ